MIISHKHKFIFIKTNKTAGTSVEIALSKFCGPDDIITPISAKDEAIRASLGYTGPQHYFAPYTDYSPSDIIQLIVRRERKKRYFNHISAEAVKKYIGDEIWNSYYKFCIERNPWDRIISLYYYWADGKTPMPTLDEFLSSKVPEILKKRGRGCYTIDNHVVADKICRYESLADDLEEVRQHLDLPEKLELPRAKTSFRKDKRSYREILTPEQGERIATMFRDEIEMFGYTF